MMDLRSGGVRGRIVAASRAGVSSGCPRIVSKIRKHKATTACAMILRGNALSMTIPPANAPCYVRLSGVSSGTFPYER